MDALNKLCIRPLGPEDYPEVTELWAASVRATHHFLQPEHFAHIEARLLSDYLPVLELYGAFAAPGQGPCLGFMGLTREAAPAPLHVEALFVHPKVLRQGVGRALLGQAASLNKHICLDVNEDNPGALGFYLAQGFEIMGRSPLDANGWPYPLLHLCRTG